MLEKGRLTRTKKNEEFNLIDKNENFIVGVGASAGGLEALEQFFKNMEPESGMSFVVVQHLSPDYKSLMVELLSKHTKMKVVRAEDGMSIAPDNVYLIPPKKNMTIFHRKLFLTSQNHSMGLNLPIDIFLRSLADDVADKAIAVILSGTGSDGTLGIRAIKGAGGMVMAQDDTAKFDGMPKSAIATGLTDYILPPDKMGTKLLSYAKHPYITKSEIQISESNAVEDTYTKVLSVIRSKIGVDFTFYKPNTIVRRIERRISVNQLDNIENYLSLLVQSQNEVNILYKELLIGVTKFFRDTEPFKIIEEKVIPEIFETKQSNEHIRIWDVACSTGEEAYSLAILIKEYMDKNKLHNDVKIFATDIDKEAIEFASAGVFPESIVADISEDRLKKYFRKKGDTYRLNEDIRQMVIFATHNIIKDPPFSKIDMIACRNLLIYFQTVMQKKVISAFSFSLNPNGFLFLGSSESVGDLANYFSSYDSKSKIYKSKDGSKAPLFTDLYLPSMRKNRYLPHYDQSGYKPNAQEEIFEEISKKLFDGYIPPAIIIDDKFELLHVFGDVNKFMKMPTGRVNLNIMNMINQDLSIAIGTAIHKSIKETKDILYKDLVFKFEGKNIVIDLDCRPFVHKRSGSKLLLVVFLEKNVLDKSSENVEQIDVNERTYQRISDLEQELKYSKENLQATIEELETSNEELQATNEELIASNEELQSTNEELQSVNEELYTVNSEYQSKIEELTELNNDISNWFSITNIGTIFLDLKLRIRKFTPAITKFINLLDQDLGRPIKHLSYNFEYPNFMDDVDFVLKTLKSSENEVRTEDNNWFLIKILPYRTTENAVKGIVITFVDITKRKYTEKQLQLEKELLIRVLDNSSTAEIMVDRSGYISYMNKKSEEILGIKKEEIIGIRYNSDIFNQCDIEGNTLKDSEMPFRIVYDTKESISDYKISIQTKNNERKIIAISGAPVYNETNEVIGAVFNLK